MLKIQIMDMLLPWLLKTGGKLLITVLIAVIGYKVIRAIRKGVGRSMEKAGLEVTLRKFLDALLYAVLIGLLVFMVADANGHRLPFGGRNHLSKREPGEFVMSEGEPYDEYAQKSDDYYKRID